jgi:hypothetical protein
MFDAEWILNEATSFPDPATVRRPGLITRKQLTKDITATWPYPAAIRQRLGQYPGDASRLDSQNAAASIPSGFGTPGSTEWASAVETIDGPAVAIPLVSNPGSVTTRLIRVFEKPDGSYRLVSLDLTTTDAGRGRRRVGSVAAPVIYDGSGDTFVQQLRRHMEESYLAADPDIRDRALRADGLAEPALLMVADDRAAVQQARAVAATYGMRTEAVRENIARDSSRLRKIVDSFGRLLAAAALWDPSVTHALVYVADQLRAWAPSALVEVIDAPIGPQLGDRLRSLLDKTAVRDAAALAAVMQLPTCAKCQPQVAKAIKEHRLSVITVAAEEGKDCVCEGRAGGGQSLGIRFALRVSELENLLIVGYQENFKQALADIGVARVRYIGNAGDPRAEAAQADLAVVVPGAAMGHSETQPYMDQLREYGVKTIAASSNQLSGVTIALIDYAVERRAELRRS